MPLFAEMYHLRPQDVWSMALADFEMLARAADQQIQAARREAAHAAAEPIRIGGR